MTNADWQDAINRRDYILLNNRIDAGLSGPPLSDAEWRRYEALADRYAGDVRGDDECIVRLVAEMEAIRG